MTDDERQALLASKHFYDMERDRKREEARQHLKGMDSQARATVARLAQEGNLEAMRLAHEFDIEIRERDYLDLIRQENIRLQSLLKETQIEQADREHASDVEVSEYMRKKVIDLAIAKLAVELGIDEHNISEGDIDAISRHLQEIESKKVR